jgi:hypothetical protein
MQGAFFLMHANGQGYMFVRVLEAFAFRTRSEPI